MHYFSNRISSRFLHQLSHISQRSALTNRIGVARGAHLAQQAIASTDAAHERDPEVDLRGRKLTAVASRRETGLGAHRGAKLKARPWEQETEPKPEPNSFRANGARVRRLLRSAVAHGLHARGGTCLCGLVVVVVVLMEPHMRLQADTRLKSAASCSAS